MKIQVKHKHNVLLSSFITLMLFGQAVSANELYFRYPLLGVSGTNGLESGGEEEEGGGEDDGFIEGEGSILGWSMGTPYHNISEDACEMNATVELEGADQGYTYDISAMFSEGGLPVSGVSSGGQIIIPFSSQGYSSPTPFVANLALDDGSTARIYANIPSVLESGQDIYTENEYMHEVDYYSETGGGGFSTQLADTSRFKGLYSVDTYNIEERERFEGIPSDDSDYDTMDVVKYEFDYDINCFYNVPM